MCNHPVADVMTRQVFTAGPDTPFREVVTILVAHDLPALPVIDTMGRPVGVVTAADAAIKLEFHGGTDLPPLLGGVRCWGRWRKAGGLTAAELMTTPAPTIPAGTSVHAALRHLADHHLAQVCVVDSEGRLGGVFTHRDALGTFLRPDSAIRADLGNRVPAEVTVHVTDGVVTLDGTLYLRSMTDRAASVAACTFGVIAVHNDLRYDVDDLTVHGI
ncbi:CBS domain-containing protein [Amycolatopsis alkalitolerans]|uniref:CBS domain-containing protein n=1 Tax=Amycolatopsis alkalitolerans TaxID=2547244 RepID=A0A5C4M8E3_9PSEU|nr:CBS domain-containing protein [Amycolatopsis alkalitolerans]TNC28033.1 CBS domain-containing protein [Amycolatopsis alkalitolerans]